MKTRSISFLLILITLCGCKKENNNSVNAKACWQGYQNGYDLPGLVVCDKTKTEAEALHPGYMFYNVNETKFCWLVSGNGTNGKVRNRPVSVADAIWKPQGYSYSKIDCNSFCNWRLVEKRKSKITGLFANATREYRETFLADSCNKLFAGRIINYIETADSVITREFTVKEP